MEHALDVSTSFHQEQEDRAVEKALQYIREGSYLAAINQLVFADEHRAARAEGEYYREEFYA